MTTDTARVIPLLEAEVDRWKALADSHRLDPDNREQNHEMELVYLGVALSLASLVNVLQDAAEGV